MEMDSRNKSCCLSRRKTCYRRGQVWGVKFRANRLDTVGTKGVSASSETLEALWSNGK